MGRGLVEGRPDLIYAGGALFGMVPVLRGTVDRANGNGQPPSAPPAPVAPPSPGVRP